MLPQGFRKFTLVFPLALLLWAGCGEESDSVAPEPAPVPAPTLLALGDSYTVGQSLPITWSWPYQLADSLAAEGDSLAVLQVIARTGWTTRDLLEAIRESSDAGALDTKPYGLVTLMIGVNNQFQGLDLAVFEDKMEILITLALELAGGDPRRVLGFSIPDYGVTPVGERFDPDRIAEEIDAYNVILGSKFGERDIIMLDVTAISRLVPYEPGLVAEDGLHYSREMYSRWVSLMLPEIRSALDLPWSSTTSRRWLP